jgi:predicted HicB family RNase H-like nuclease
MNDKPKKDTVIIARINSKLKRAIENAAKQNGQTVTGYIEKLVENDLRAKFEPIS